MTTVTISRDTLQRIAVNCTDPDTTDALDVLLAQPAAPLPNGKDVINALRAAMTDAGIEGESRAMLVGYFSNRWNALLPVSSDSQPAAPVQAELPQVDVAKAMRQAFNLGQTYWQQADSEYMSQQKKSDATAAKFKKLSDETVAALATQQPAQQPVVGVTLSDAKTICEAVLNAQEQAHFTGTTKIGIQACISALIAASQQKGG